MTDYYIKIPMPYPKQIEFFKATNRFIAYGGARGGGKSWAARIKSILLAINYNGIQILFLRRTLPELRENHVIPMKKILNNTAKFSEQSKTFSFPNGSRIVLGYCKNESDVLQYQGQSYDVIFMEEATQFTEFQFMALTESNRSSGLCQKRFKPRMYFTCNPGGVGHHWVKRLFIDKSYRNSECQNDYVFIKSLVFDNNFIIENSPDYIRTLENLPEDRRRAMLYGDWDVYSGQYFPEFDRNVHVIEPFEIDGAYTKYFAMDYGMDMLAGYFIAVDIFGKAFVYKEIYKSGLIISEAAEIILLLKGDDEICQFIAPPDMWNRQHDTGKSVAEIFGEYGIFLNRADNRRIQGWYNLKEWLKVSEINGVKSSNVKIFSNCKNLIRCLPLVQHDSRVPNDVSKEPHELTHSLDALRYFVAGRPCPASISEKNGRVLPFELRGNENENKSKWIW